MSDFCYREQRTNDHLFSLDPKIHVSQVSQILNWVPWAKKTKIFLAHGNKIFIRDDIQTLTYYQYLVQRDSYEMLVYRKSFGDFTI